MSDTTCRPASRGIVYAIAAAALFGASTPFAKLLVGRADPVLIAGLLYLGSGCGLSLWRWLRNRGRKVGTGETPLRRTDCRGSRGRSCSAG